VRDLELIDEPEWLRGHSQLSRLRQIRFEDIQAYISSAYTIGIVASNHAEPERIMPGYHSQY
jgi:hypothetical protein